MQIQLSRRTAVRLFALAAALPMALTVLPGGNRSAAAQTTPLAIKGYDPVAYFTVGKPTPGLAEFEHVWDEHRYRFASMTNRDLFKTDPARYAPQFGNFCAMALAKGMVVVADPENWLVSDGKLYVFGSPAPAGPALFQKDLAGNISKASDNRQILPKK
jgi:hypothetical protein